MMDSAGTTMIQSVRALNGNKQTKNATTTVPSIITTCFLYFMTLWDGTVIVFCDAVRLGWSISVLAIKAYRNMSIARGNRKKSNMDKRKNKQGGSFSTLLKQTNTVEPS